MGRINPVKVSKVSKVRQTWSGKYQTSLAGRSENDWV
jgi:hypothetical protein